MSLHFRAGRTARCVLAASLGIAVVGTAAPAFAGSPTVLTATATPTNPVVGSLLTIHGTVTPAATAPVRVQLLVGRSWLSGSAVLISGRNLTASFRLPASPTTLSLRLARAATGTTNAGVSPAMVVHVVEPAGTVLAWGGNTHGQLGDGVSSGFSTVPVNVTGLSGVVAVAGHHSTDDDFGNGAGYALKADGTVWAWGRNNHGALGNGTYTDSSVPVQVSGLSGVKAIAAGEGSGYALKTDGTVWAWGHNNDGQLGVGNETDRPTPAQVVGLSSVEAIAAAGFSVYALRSNGDVWSWGRDVTQLDFNTPTIAHPWAGHVNGIANVKAIGADLGDGYAIRTDGTLWEWGGVFTNHETFVPLQVEGISNAVAVASSGYDSFILDSAGTVQRFAQMAVLGDPVPVPGLTGITAISASDVEGCLYSLTSAGTVLALGTEQVGELGNGQQTGQADTPVAVKGLTHVTAIGAGSEAGFAVAG
ncbi:hypothetical protein acdb102_05650 [Acidothermaceae bacterium B102]|nr:hypothetical protein acdb102_05650 [Acidothermaceae bacterium B102]